MYNRANHRAYLWYKLHIVNIDRAVKRALNIHVLHYRALNKPTKQKKHTRTQSSLQSHNIKQRRMQEKYHVMFMGICEHPLLQLQCSQHVKERLIRFQEV